MHAILRIADPSPWHSYLTTSYWASHPVEQLSADNFAAPVAAAFSTLHGFQPIWAPWLLCRSPLPVYIHSANTSQTLSRDRPPRWRFWPRCILRRGNHKPCFLSRQLSGDAGLFGRRRNAHPHPYLMPQSLQKPSPASWRRPWCLHNKHAAKCITSPWRPPA